LRSFIALGQTAVTPMSDSADERRDLPVLLHDDSDLPVTLVPECASEERVPPAHTDWSTYASQLEVRGLASGVSGDLWAATAGGVLRWRGRDRFVRYGSEHGLFSNSIIDITLDGADCPWALASPGRLSRLKNGTWQPCHIPVDAAASCLTVDRAGSVWVGTTAGLLATNSGADTAADLPFNGDYAVGEPPRAIAILDETDAWACSAQGLFHFADGYWRRRISRAGILTLTFDEEFLWFGTLDGLGRIDLRNDTLESWKRGATTALAAAGSGGVWAASGGRVGLARGTDWHPVAGQSPGLMTALAPAAADEVYVGTSSGILRCGFARSESWSTGAAPDVIGLSGTLGTLIQAIAVGQRGGENVIWVGTPSGLFEFVPAADRWTHLGGRRVEDVRAIASAGDRVWIGSWRSGLRELRDGEIGPPIIAEPIVALAADSASAGCFAMAPDTVYRVDRHGMTRVVVAEELQQGTWLNTMAADGDGTLFVGSAAGLFAFSAGGGIRVVHGDFAGTDVLALLSAGQRADTMLVGTSRGLYAGTPGHLAAVDALAGCAVTALAWDEARTAAWVGTREGLVHVRQADEGWVPTAKLTSEGSGLASDEVCALAVDERGLWIGTPSGLSSYLP
jgi:ligand-binding sensor domain-containing protein